MRGIMSTHNLIAVSAYAMETAINAEQTLDVGMLCARGSLPQFEARRETNDDEAHGLEEPDAIYNLGGLSSFPMNFPKCQAQHAAFVLAYGLGAISSAGWGTGYKHTITPISGDVDSARSNPSFTFAVRHGLWLTKERFASGFIDNFRMDLKKDSWLVLDANIKGTGKRTSNIIEESVSGFMDDTSLTLAANGLAGSTAAERLNAIHFVKVQTPVTLEWVDVVCSAGSDASPAVLTITAPGVAHTACTYKVIYEVKEAGSYAWCSFPARVSEPPLRVTDFLVNIGGSWDGSALTGGHQVSADINSLTWEFNNNITPDFTPGASSGDYANRALRDGRSQRITFDRMFRDAILQAKLDADETFTLYAKATGDEFEGGKNYQIEIIWPKVAVLKRTIREEGKRLAEATDFTILEDATYGSVKCIVANKQAAYAA